MKRIVIVANADDSTELQVALRAAVTTVEYVTKVPVYRAYIDGELNGHSDDELVYADLMLDVGACLAHRSGREISLTRLEYLVLEYLMRNAGVVLSKARIYESVWEADLSDTSNALGMVLGTLRRKLGKPALIQTVYGLGYTMRSIP